MDREEHENRYRIDAVYRACMALKEISASDDPMNVTEIADALEISKDIAFRTLETLEECGFITRVEGGYVVGESVALMWKRYRVNQKASIERARTALAKTSIVGEGD